MSSNPKSIQALTNQPHARLHNLVKHRKSAYLQALDTSTNPEYIRSRWLKYKQARQALDQKKRDTK